MRIEFETSNNEKVAAEYFGGAYVDLYFGGHPRPSEVINVWDYEKGGPARVIETPGELTRVVWEWVEEMDPDWYETHLANLP